jgi:peptidoglycan/xylan/chitin deacetylase (PgdA/CDA1 family)
LYAFDGVGIIVRSFRLLVVAVLWLAVQPGLAIARPLEPDCSHGQGLGVSRVEVVDTSGGPRFGRQYQADGTSFLKPGEVVLTFDDGPFAVTTKPILATLDRFCAKATFFAVGRMAVVQPETLKEIVRKGHTVASHTWAHANLGHLGSLAQIAEVEKGFSALTEVLGGAVAPFFRFPYLNAPESELERLAERNVAVFGIDVDSTDARGHDVSSKRIVERTLAGLEKTGKGVILLHDIKPATAAALPELLAALKEKGYRLVHVVPKENFVPNAAFSAEIAEIMLKRQQEAGGRAGQIAASSGSYDVAGGLRHIRHLRKGKIGHQRAVKTKNVTKGRAKRGNAQQMKPGNRRT